jgi:hypothetical protein
VPEQIDSAAYEHATAEIDYHLERLPGLVAIYGTGGLTAPGISDIDRIAVVDRHIADRGIWSQLSPRTREIAMHTPFVVDRQTFTKHHWFAHLDSLALVSGAAVCFDEPEDRNYLTTLHAAEGLIVTLVSLMKQQWLARYKVRPLLCDLHSLRYSLGLAGLERVDAPTGWALVDEVITLRRNWFQPDHSITRFTTLRRLIERAGPALLSVLHTLGTASDINPTASRQIAMRGPWSNVILVEDRGDDVAVNRLAPPKSVAVTRRWRRASELRWRLRRHRLAISAPSLALLSIPQDDRHIKAWEQREEIVRNYNDFVQGCSGEWSMIGFAHLFTP